MQNADNIDSRSLSSLVDWLKLTVILSVIYYTTNDALVRFYELSASENPIRNRLVFVAIWGISLYVIIAAAFLESVLLRFLCASVFSVSTFTSEAYKAVTKSTLSYGDLYSLWIARVDYKCAISNYWRAALFSLGLSLLFWLAMVWPVRSILAKNRMVKLAKFGFIVPFVIISFMVAKKGGAAAIGLPKQIQPAAMFAHIVYFDTTNDFDATRNSSVDISPKSIVGVRPNIVLVVDESVRGDFLSINNPAARTTPFLESQSHRIANFGYASSTHDCSHYANANLRYGTYSADPTNSLLTNPSIWEYAKHAGYQTTYLDAQRRHGQLQNFMSPRERRAIDYFIQFSDVDAVERSDAFVTKDQRAASVLQDILERTTPQFVIVNKEGVHAPYEGKYPESETQFSPTMMLNESIHPGLPRDKLVNSYRNAIAWSVDKFFATLLSSRNERLFKNSVVIYTGDHGQNLLNEGTPTHCGSPNPPSVVGLVPLFVVTDHLLLRDELQNSARKNYNKASHFNIFSTMMFLMGYQPNESKQKYDPKLTENLSGTRWWFTGDILNKAMRRHDFYFNPANAEPKS